MLIPGYGFVMATHKERRSPVKGSQPFRGFCGRRWHPVPLSAYACLSIWLAGTHLVYSLTLRKPSRRFFYQTVLSHSNLPAAPNAVRCKFGTVRNISYFTLFCMLKNGRQATPRFEKNRDPLQWGRNFNGLPARVDRPTPGVDPVHPSRQIHLSLAGAFTEYRRCQYLWSQHKLIFSSPYSSRLALAPGGFSNVEAVSPDQITDP